MSTKKKLVISLTSLAIVLVVAVVAVGITLAALNGKVNSSFTITYTAHKNVKATVSASYKIGDLGEEVKFKQDPGYSEDQLEFAADQETATGTLKVKDPITLEFVAGKKYVVVSYTFKNEWKESDAGKTNLKITASQTTLTGDGLTIKYDKDGNGDFSDTDLTDIAVIAPGESKTIKIKFELTENDQGTKTVSLQVNLNWTLETEEIGG